MLIGITGPSGAGKSIVASEFKKNGIPVIDADEVARHVTAPGTKALSEIKEAFGEEYIAPDETLLRKKLAGLVFSNPEKLALLNSVIKKYIDKEIASRIASCASPILALDAPLLIEYELHLKCDLVIAVLSDRKERIVRICERDKISRQDAENRINNQKNDDFYIQSASLVLYNNNGLDELKNETKKIIESLKNAKICQKDKQI